MHRMRMLVLQQYATPLVRQCAATIAAGTGTASRYQTRLVREWLARYVGFLRDPIGHELLHTPELLVAAIQQHGAVDVDCDDVAMLGAALGMAIGLRARFVMIGRDGGYEHIWSELCGPNAGDAWEDLDITRPYQADFTDYDMTIIREV